MVLSAWWPLAGNAQSVTPYEESVTYAHQDGTQGTSVGFWQRMRNAGLSMSLATFTGPGDGNIWKNIEGTDYVLMSTLVDEGQANTLRTSGTNVPISGASSFTGQIWLTPGYSLNNYLNARPSEWTATTINNRATQAIGADFVFGPGGNEAFSYEAALWVNPNTFFRPAVNWDIASSAVYNTPNHTNWDPYNTPSQFAGTVLTDGTTSYTFTEAYGYDYEDWFMSWWNDTGDPQSPDYFPFPWAGLGFTYDWFYQSQADANPASIIGLSEFIFAQHPNAASPADFIYYLESLDTIYASVVPEPSACALVLAGLALLWLPRFGFEGFRTWRPAIGFSR